MGTPLSEAGFRPYVLRLVDRRELIRMTSPTSPGEICWYFDADSGAWFKQLRYNGKLVEERDRTYTGHQVAASVNAYRAAGYRLLSPPAVTL